MQILSGGDPLISVVICTRNRARLLNRALISLVEQAFPRRDYEILVVDNQSTDRTYEIVKQFQEKGVRYLREDRIGSSVARNTGWSNAAGRYIAFFDDDGIASPEWLAAIREGFSSGPPLVGVIRTP
jgi:glucosyl-dolichyl phosphate glucuronosyltransferase